MPAYLGLVHKDPDSDYGVSFPDVPGCVTAGQDMQQAWDWAHEAIGLHVGSMVADGEAMPASRTLSEIEADPEFALDLRDAIAVMRIEYRPIELEDVADEAA